MRRILVIGCSGAGKSVLARALGKKLDLPVVHLDQLLFLPGWCERSHEEFDALLEAELARDCWVMDGNFCRTLARRLEFADTVIFLHTSRLICLAGVLQRWIRYHGRSRPDLAVGCPEKIDPAFLRYVWNYEKVTLPRVEELLSSRPERCRLIRLESRSEAENFLSAL